MKVLTVHQPWAELIACGAKRIETRAWNTWYRGPLAIHASMDKRTWKLKEPISKKEFYPFMNDGGWARIEWGAIIAVCNLRDCMPISNSLYAQPFKQDYWKMVETPHGFEQKLVYSIQIPPQEPELSFGDYTPGRYAWILEDVMRLDDPIPARGRQRLWDYYFGVDDNNAEPNKKLVKYLEYHKERKHE